MTDRNPKPGETWRARYGAVFPLLARYNPDDDYTLRQDVPKDTDPGTKALSWTANGRFLLSGEHPLDPIERVVVVPGIFVISGNCPLHGQAEVRSANSEASDAR